LGAVTVTALLVSHDGARWLPAVLDGLARQTRSPDCVVAVDTGSADAGVALLEQHLAGTSTSTSLVAAPAGSSYGAAVRAGLAAVPASGGDDWVWLLHDDSAPAPTALERLLAAALDNPSASILGPKLREWPSLRRLLEVGVTISGTGRRETGLEPGEYDQGQHDRVRDVLAVNTAGMLVRRDVLERLGFDERLPVFGNDIDLGWRAARAGLRTLAVPDAVVFHVEAAHRGVRRTPVTGSFRRAERRAALYTVLVNCSPWALPLVTLRLLLGSLVRGLGLLLVRAPREALDELTALASVYARPDRIVSARLQRRRSATVPARAVRHLLAPPWVPYRHGVDFVTEVGSAVVHQAGDLSSARRERGLAATETGPVPEEAQNLPADTGLLARLVANPVAAVFAVLVVAALVAARGLVGTGMLSGGALLPAPGSATGWWAVYAEAWHQIGLGSAAPAAPYLLPMAVAGTVLLGKAWLLVDLLFLMAVPVAAWGGYRFLLQVTGSRAAAAWGGAAYGLLPVLGGAVQQGRLGTVVATLTLPWLAHAALFLGSADRDRRWRAAWRTSLWLALLSAFVPLAWVFAGLAAAVMVGTGVVGPRDGSHRRQWSMWGPVLVALAAVPVLLLPWSLESGPARGAAWWLFEAGLPAPALVDPLSRWDVVLGRPGAAGAPGWLSIGVLVAAVLALARPDTRRRVLGAWAVLVLGLAVTAVLAGTSFAPLSGSPAQPLWLGFPLLVVQASGICAAAIAATGIRLRLTGVSFGWRQPVGVVVVVVALLSPIAGVVWWVAHGSGGPLDRAAASTVPTYMSDAAAADPLHGVLVVRGSHVGRFDYLLLRGPGLRLGDDTVLPPLPRERPLTRIVTDLVTGPRASDIAALARRGVGFVYAPPPADTDLVANMDSVSGVSSGSALRPGSRAWQLEATPTATALHEHPSAARPWLLAAQALVLIAVAVLAAPTRRRRR
jgi:GT2 family glycosyltransferase